MATYSEVMRKLFGNTVYEVPVAHQGGNIYSQGLSQGLRSIEPMTMNQVAGTGIGPVTMSQVAGKGKKRGVRNSAPRFRARGMDKERAATQYTHLPMGQGDALGRLGLGKYQGDFGESGIPERPYQGDFGESGVPTRPAVDPLAPELPPEPRPRSLQEVPPEPRPRPLPIPEQDNKVSRPITQWDSFEQNFRNVRNPETGEMYSGGEYNFSPTAPAPVQPARAPAPVQPARNAAPVQPARAPAPAVGIPGRSVDVTGMNRADKLEQMRLAERGQLPVGEYVSPTGVTASEVLELGGQLNDTLNRNTTNGGFMSLPDGRQRVNPVGLMGGGVTEGDRARTYYNRHTGRWTEPPLQRSEADLTRAQQNAVDRGMTLREDGTLVGAGAGGPGADPSARRRYMNYMDAGLPVSDELIEAAGGDRTALEYARMKRNERAQEMDDRKNRTFYNAAQRGMARRNRLGEGPAPTPINVRAFMGDEQAQRAQYLGQAGLSRVAQEEARADAARDVAKTEAEAQLGVAGLESETQREGFRTQVDIANIKSQADLEMASGQIAADMYQTKMMSRTEKKKAKAATEQARIAADAQRYAADTNSRTQITISNQEQASRAAEIAVKKMEAETAAELAEGQLSLQRQQLEPAREAAMQRAAFITAAYEAAVTSNTKVDPDKILAMAERLYPGPKAGLRPRATGGRISEYEQEVSDYNRNWGDPGIVRWGNRGNAFTGPR